MEEEIPLNLNPTISLTHLSGEDFNKANTEMEDGDVLDLIFDVETDDDTNKPQRSWRGFKWFLKHDSIPSLRVKNELRLFIGMRTFLALGFICKFDDSHNHRENMSEIAEEAVIARRTNYDAWYNQFFTNNKGDSICKICTDDPMCGLKYSTVKSSKASHAVNHIMGHFVRFCCVICGKCFSSMDLFNSHSECGRSLSRSTIYIFDLIRVEEFCMYMKERYNVYIHSPSDPARLRSWLMLDARNSLTYEHHQPVMQLSWIRDEFSQIILKIFTYNLHHDNESVELIKTGCKTISPSKLDEYKDYQTAIMKLRSLLYNLTSTNINNPKFRLEINNCMRSALTLDFNKC